MNLREKVLLFTLAILGIAISHYACHALHAFVHPRTTVLYPGEKVCQTVSGGSLCYTPYCPSPNPAPGAVARVFDESEMISWQDCGLSDFVFYPTPLTTAQSWFDSLSNFIAGVLNYIFFGVY